MKIVLMEPLGVAPEIIERLADKLRDDGHTFTAYDSFTTDTDELIRRASTWSVQAVRIIRMARKRAGETPARFASARYRWR